MFGVTILGNNSALPAFNRHPTAQIVTIKNQLILIDCGEGTQMQIDRFKIKRSKINYILISHLHGDHYFGLVPLLTTMGLLGRENELYLFAPPKLKEIIDLQMEVAKTNLPFKLNFVALSEEGKIYENDNFVLSCFKTIHRIECFGFKIEEKKPSRKIDSSKISKYVIPYSFYKNLKKGEDFITNSGEIVKNETVTIENTFIRSYAYCADTIYDENLIDKVKNVTLLYHEATYLKDLESKAIIRFHCTTHQAASIALKATVSQLIIGHFSSKYEFLDDFLIEAKEVFGNTHLAIEGVTFRL